MAAAVPVILAVGSAGLNAYSSYKQGKDQRDYYNDLASQNEEQAIQTLDTAKINRAYIFDEASRQTEDVQEQLGQILGSQKTVMAGSGLSLSSKTAEDLARSTINAENEDELAIRYNAESSANELMRQSYLESYNLKKQASSYRKAGKKAYQAGKLGIFSSLLGGASGLAFKMGSSSSSKSSSSSSSSSK